MIIINNIISISVHKGVQVKANRFRSMKTYNLTGTSLFDCLYFVKNNAFKKVLYSESLNSYITNFCFDTLTKHYSFINHFTKEPKKEAGRVFKTHQMIEKSR